MRGIGEQPPTVFSRLIALAIGPSYLMYVAYVGWSVTRMSPWLVLALVLAGAGAIMAVLVVFGIKAFRHRGPARRFQLSTFLLIVLPLSIYLAAIRCVFHEVGSGENNVEHWGAVVIFSLVFIVVSTSILLWFAEALMWLAVLALKRRPVGRSGGPG
jgi:hypothetical protein